MSDLAFHTGIPDRQLYACRALKKAQRLGMSACVLVETEEDLYSFDERLWSFDNTSFIPHGAAGSAEIRHGAFVIGRRPSELPAADLLVMLTHNAPGNMQDLMKRFSKIIDVVASSGVELEEGRNRYRSYKNQGLQPKVVNPKN